MESSENKWPLGARGIDRRRFLKLGAASLFGLATGLPSAAASPPYEVGIGRSADFYEATRRAVLASRGWPSALIIGKKVVIKPNLVLAKSADTGMVTDPEVVRALVDLALEDGAAEVCIVESGNGGANFAGCGYGIFESYDPQVRLIDLGQEVVSLAEVPGGMTYRQLYLPESLLAEDVFFISAAKLKTHNLAYATLSLKNLFGLAPLDHYTLPSHWGLWALHLRGLHEAVIDLNLCRPVNFAVVDGIWAMEGNGPIMGTPVEAGMVVAGANAVAVDRVCLEAMGLPQNTVLHLSYASRLGMGPSRFADITLLGDGFQSIPFEWASQLPPLMEYPRVWPAALSPSKGTPCHILTRHYPLPCLRRIDVFKVSDLTPEMIFVKTLRGWERRNPGMELNSWDGKDDNGSIVETGSYVILVQAKFSADSHPAYTSGRVDII